MATTNISPNTDALLQFTLKTSENSLVSGAVCTVDVYNPLGTKIIADQSAPMTSAGVYQTTINYISTLVNGVALRGVYKCIIKAQYSGANSQQLYYYEVR